MSDAPMEEMDSVMAYIGNEWTVARYVRKEGNGHVVRKGGWKTADIFVEHCTPKANAVPVEKV